MSAWGIIVYLNYEITNINKRIKLIDKYDLTLTQIACSFHLNIHFFVTHCNNNLISHFKSLVFRCIGQMLICAFLHFNYQSLLIGVGCAQWGFPHPRLEHRRPPIGSSVFSSPCPATGWPRSPRWGRKCLCCDGVLRFRRSYRSPVAATGWPSGWGRWGTFWRRLLRPRRPRARG